MERPQLELAQLLSRLNFEGLNAVQSASVEANQHHDNVMLLSKTGSGKTLAFLLPVLERLDRDNKEVQAMVIVPSRELAMQIEKVFKQMGTGYKVTCCYGGHKREIEENNLIQPPALVIGTPGRLADHLRRGNIKGENIRTLVLDEFDKSLELGFLDEMEEIVRSLPHIEKRILTSATYGVDIPDFLELQTLYKLDFLDGTSDASPNRLELKVVHAHNRDKATTLLDLIGYLGSRPTIIFCNQREYVEDVHFMLKEAGIYSVFYHGAMEQRDRESALAKFRNGTSHILVTTDLAARGLDIPYIRYIVHYQLPLTEDAWTHRNGRTARMDASGTAILMLGDHEHLPRYLPEDPEEIRLEGPYELPDKPKWTTFHLPLGKKNKVNKVDVVGFLIQKGALKKEDIGLIEVKDFSTFVAIKRTKASHVLHVTKEEKIKGKKAKLEIAK